MSYDQFDKKVRPDDEELVLTQPATDRDYPPVHANPPPFPEDYLLLSLFTFLCCCTPLGLYAVIRGSHVKVLHAGGFYRQASDTSRVVRLVNLVGIVLGTLIQLIMGVMMIIYMVVVYKAAKEMRMQYGTASPGTTRGPFAMN